MEDLDSALHTDFLSTLGEPVFKDGCIFCKIAQGKEPRTNILFQNEAVTVFHDIRPATKEHLLIIPKSHHGPVKSLSATDLPLMDYLRQVGKAVIEARGGILEESRVGFHWPPFYSVEHLHLHVIYPEKQMAFLARLIFKPNTYWFVSYDWAFDWLQRRDRPRRKSVKEVSEASSRDSGTGTHI
ncbi:adenosine 5'-monophosphoramidase HINT3-like [Diadema antillarum]|uniref:adenosine 5'-monophosphoramidase HINT3-like n=1 Tax=Diadema antillarum TaxID=105358 RepID=UPI003A881180